MAPSRVIKSLNTGPGAKRFVFKTFAQRVEEVDVDVFRSLAPVKFEPTSGSSFFHENLVRWRELNCAADFNDVYHELSPLVQTLPQLLHHKDTIMKSLLSRVRISAILSLEPILSLIALLSRDLQEEFIPYLDKFFDVCADLLKSGGDQEPELLEQVFISVSYIIKYLIKFLAKDTLLILRVTKSLRFYHRSYVQDFVAESVSFLLRKAPPKQLIKGIRRLLSEVESDPCETKISSCCSLLYNTLKGPSSGLHSQAEPFLQLLLDQSILSGGPKKYNVETGEVAVDIVARTFLMLCDDIKRDKIEPLWECLLGNIHQELAKSCNEDLVKTKSDNIGNRSALVDQSNGVTHSTPLGHIKEGDEEAKSSDQNGEIRNFGQVHLMHLLKLLNTVLEFAKGSRVNDYGPLFGLVPELLKPEVILTEAVRAVSCFVGPVAPAMLVHDPSAKLLAEVLRFLLALAKSHAQVAGASGGPGIIAKAAPKWVLAFECKNIDCLIPFLRGIIQLDVMLLQAFAPYVARTLDRLIEEYPADTLPLLLDMSQKLDLKLVLGPETERLSNFVIRLVKGGISALRLKDGQSELDDASEPSGVDPAMLWAALQCVPVMTAQCEESESIAWEYVVAVENSCTSVQDAEDTENSSKVREFLLATALSAHLQTRAAGDPHSLLHHTDKYLDLALKYKTDSHVLNALADLLERSKMTVATEDLRTDMAAILDHFTANLGDSRKSLRVGSLRILAHYESLAATGNDGEQAPAKRRKRLDGQQNESEMASFCQVFRNLLTVESSPLTVENCRKSTLLINAMKVDACSGRMPSSYLLALANSLSGLLYNRFAALWDPVTETLAAMLETHAATLWDFFLPRLDAFQSTFLFEKRDNGEGDKAEDLESALMDIWGRFESCMVEKHDCTRIGTLLSLQLKILQKVPRIAEARSRQLIPLFLTFVGHSQSEEKRLESHVGKGKEWKAALKEWLNLIREMKNARALYCGPVMKDILLNRFLGDSEPAIQEVTLDCLLNWKDKYLTSYETHLKNLVSSKAIREELTTWDVSKESHEIKDEERQPLLSVVLMLLFPRIMRRTVKSLGKSGVGAQRNAVLSFLARLESNELAPLFCQLLKPLQSSFGSDGAGGNASDGSWMALVESGADSRFIEQVNTQAVATIPYKRKMGFLHMVLAILDSFNVHQLRPYIHALLAIVLRLLEACAFDISAQEVTTPVMDDELVMEKIQGEDLKQEISAQVEAAPVGNDKDRELAVPENKCEISDQDGVEIGNQEEEVEAADTGHSNVGKGRGGAREIKVLCLKVISAVLKRFDDMVFSPVYWDIFFTAVRRSIARFVEENSSSTSPSALLQCFIIMSQRMDLAPLLSKDPMLVPNLVSLLAVRGTSAPVVSAVLTIMENILDLVSAGNAEDENAEAVRGVLSPNLSILLSSFRECLSFLRESAGDKRLLKRALKILSRLSIFVVDKDATAQLVGVLLPMLKVKRKVDQGVCLEVLQLLESIGSALEKNIVAQCLPVLAPLLTTMSNRDIRVAVSGTLRALANVDPSLSVVAELLMDLNSMSSTDIDEFDYTRRLAAYDRISKSFFSQLTRIQALLVLSSVIFDMGSNDMSIRHRASDTLQEFVRFASSLSDEFSEENPSDLSEKEISQIEDVPEEDTVITENFQSETSVCKTSSKSLKSIVPTFLLASVKNAIRGEALVVRREWVLLLREMVVNFGNFPTLKEYENLINKDVEADFFFNIVHLQVHRRIRAMGKFRTLCAASHFSQGALSKVFVPLFMNSLHEAKGDKEGNLVSAAIETLACIAAQIPWEPYFTLLMRCFRVIGSKPEFQKIYVRVACAVLDKFHFYIPSSKVDEGNDGLPVGGEKQEIVLSSSNPAMELTCDNDSCQLPAEILKLLRERVLPEIRGLMVLKGDIVSTPVALTQVKILKLMPAHIIEVELPQVVRTIINLLKSRRQAIRDEARAALVAISETLGAHYLRFIVEVLQESLTRGFEMHVLGFTIHSILVKLLPTVKIGEIDYCVEQLLGVLENDIFGEVAEEKDVEAIAGKMRETKSVKSYESLKLLSEFVTFQTQATVLLGPVRRNLLKSLLPKMKSKIESMLSHISLGLLHNKSVTQTDLLVIVHAIIEDGVNEEQAVLKAAAVKKQMRAEAMSGTIKSVPDSSSQVAKAPPPNFYLITEFALQLLSGFLKRVKITFRDARTLSMLNPLVILLQECLTSKYDGVLAGALKCLSSLLLLPLPAIDKQGTDLTVLIFSICQRFSKTESPLLIACVNVLVILIRQCKTLRLSEEQLKSLLQLPIFIDMEEGSRMALSLLKAIVGRKLLVPELYDMINRVARLMVTSHLLPVRQLCSQILLQFLLDYPLGPKRLQQHLDYFITNTGYVEASGREAALEMLHTIIVKFPDSVVEEQGDSMFFPLVTRLVNDESNQVRSMIGSILKVLMERVGPHKLQRFVDFSLSWYKGSDPRLWRPAAQVLGFMIEVMGTNSERISPDILLQCLKILALALSSLNTKENEVDETGKAQFWQETYFSLTMMEKLFQILPTLLLQSEYQEFWKFVCPLLLHQHLWIRKVCGRLIGMYFGGCGEASAEDLRSAALGKNDVLFLHPSWLLLLVGSLCQQLDGGSVDEVMGEHLVKILVDTSALLRLLPHNGSKPSGGELPESELGFLGCEDADSKDRISRALVLLGWGKKSRARADTPNHGSTKNQEILEGETVEDGSGDKALRLVFSKLHKIALRVHPLQTKVIFRWYAAMACKLTVDEVENYVDYLLFPLFKITEGSAAKVVPEDIKRLGVEVLNKLREVLGASRFVNAYNAAREKVKESRDKRKIAQKISVLVDPERNAKRKLNKSAKRQIQKKRKIIHEKRSRGL
ncbi:hypothetical protein R1flu_014611 [Riccia fluitans]|uniref:HEAT repeat-containing protein 1 n=1 Tax=Riccia fluitans TaxID=41844 RepID=A0ABD1YGY8_9MARC